jgi:uncharacterized repeat protein (TIGR01451 family)
MMIVAMFSFAGLVFATGPNTNVPSKVHPPLVVTDEDAQTPAADAPPAGLAAAPANDLCAGAIPLTLNITTKGTTVDANDDYQSPSNAVCFSGTGQALTTAPGRDVVYSFNPPSTRDYSFRIVQQSPTDVIRTQNEVLYVGDPDASDGGCPAGGGTVSCLKGANRPQSAAFISSTGSSNNQSEEVDCISLDSSKTYYVYFDDGGAGNAGGAMSLEVIECNREVEPNDEPATATPFVCGILGTSATPAYHCHLGTRGGTGVNGTANDGAVCTRTGFLDQSFADSNMRCSISDTPCSVNVATGVGTCGAGEGFCQQHTDLDCDSRCDVGPNAGLSCTTNAFCNPVSDQGAVCAGTCQPDSVCVITATQVATATSCTPVCVGGLFPGRYCSVISGCPGGGVCTVSAMCPAGQVCSRQYNEGDPDFYSLGTLAPSSKVFAGIDAKSANDYDFRMRVNTATSTLQFDDDDGVSRNGALAPEIAGALVPSTAGGTAAFIQVSRTQPRSSEPYELYSIVRPPLASAQAEAEIGAVGNDIYFGWPGDVYSANQVTAAGNGYVKGLFNGTHGGFAYDSDCFKFLVHKGDLMSWYGDGEPSRLNSSASVTTQFPQPVIYDAEPAGISNFIFGANARKNTAPTVAGLGLNALTPAVTSTFFQWRSSYTGMLEVCYYDGSVPLGLGVPGTGTQTFNWAGSLDCNCGPCQWDSPGAEVSVVKTGPTGPLQAGSFQTYTITVTNNSTGPNEIATEVHLLDVLDPNLLFISLSVDDGFTLPENQDITSTLVSNNTSCILNDGFQFLSGLPLSGTSGTIDCTNTSMAPGTTTTYTLKVQVANCIGAGIDISNTATISTTSADSDPNNNSSTTGPATTSDDGSCVDLFCPDDGSPCYPDLCTSANSCVDGVCGGDEVQCDDQNLCTDDICVPETGCVYDSSQLGDLCDDFIGCTANSCDPVLFCQFTDTCNDGNSCTDDVCNVSDPEIGCEYTNDDTNACSDGNACTSDSCAGGGCVGSQISCDDQNPCTDDSCDTALGCQYTTHNCDDGNACTDDSCNPSTGCQYAATNCDDGNCCTIDECNPASGCFYTANTTAPVIDVQPSLAPEGQSCAILWPPQHGYVDFGVAATGTHATSACGVASYQFASCSSSQAENAVGVGDGNSWRDCVYTSSTLSLRAERDGACSPIGRVYTSSVTATDVCGNTSAPAALTVSVWHDRGHEPDGEYYSANPGSNQNDQRPLAINNPGGYGTGCGTGTPCATGTGNDSSDFDPEMEIFQGASISVGDLRVAKAGAGNVGLSWTEPAHEAGINVTRFHIYRLDPVTLFWTLLGEVTKQTTTWQDPTLADGLEHQYKVSALIK